MNQSTALINPRENEWSVMREMATVAFKSAMLPTHIKTEQAALFIVMKGRELGIPATYALSNIVVIQGKPTANAELMLALIYRDHGDNAIQFQESTPAKCTVLYKRKSWAAPLHHSFTIEEARTAGLLSNATWQKYPTAMLRARCISAVARLAFPDSIGGMYTPEELGANVAVSDDDQITIVEEPQILSPAKVLTLSLGPQTIESETVTAGWVREFARLKGIDIDNRLANQGKPKLDDMEVASLEKVYAWLQQAPNASPVPKEEPQQALTATQQRIVYFWSELAKIGKERFTVWAGQLQHFSHYLETNGIEYNAEIATVADIPDEHGDGYAKYLGNALDAETARKNDDPLI